MKDTEKDEIGLDSCVKVKGWMINLLRHCRWI